MSKRTFVSELTRRNVLRAAAFYAASAWLLVQIATQVFPFFDVPNWVVRWIVIAAIVGFPFAMLFAWFYEWTPDGLKRESEVEPHESIMQMTGKRLDRGILAVLGLVVLLLLTDRFVLYRSLNAPAATSAIVAPEISPKSIAVLPLVNESGDPANQYFSDGLSEELISRLTQISSLKVIGRNSAFRFRDTQDDSATIGRLLGVATLLDGTVRQHDDRVRIVVGLINAVDGTSLWSQTYDREMKDLFDVQSDIAQSVAGALQVKLLGEAGTNVSDKPPSGSIDAYNAYLQCSFHNGRVTENDVRTAIEYCQKAIALDPRYAEAYAEIADSWTSLAIVFLGGEQARQGYANARTAIDTALALNPDLVDAHSARGYLLSNVDFDQIGAQTEFRRALQLAPNDGPAKLRLGTVLASLGQLDEAIELTRAAIVTDPLRASWYATLVSYLSPLDRLDEAERVIRKAIELQPSSTGGYSWLAIIAIQRGDAAAALTAAQQEPEGPWHDITMALARQISGDPVATDAALKNLIDRYADADAFQIAEVYALRKDPDTMFEWLDRAWVNRDPGIASLLFDHFLLAYQDDPRFGAYCRKVGLPVPGVDVPALKPATPANSSTTTTGISATP